MDIIVVGLLSVIFILLITLIINFPTRRKVFLKFWSREYQLFWDQLPEAIIILDTQSRIKNMNRKAEDLTGFTLKEVHHKPYDSVFRCPAPHIQDLDNKILSKTTRHLTTKNNTQVTIIESQTIIEDIDENFIGIMLHFTRAFDDNQTNKQLQLIQSISHKLFELVNIGLIITDSKGVILSVNDYFQKMINISKNEAIGKPLHSISPIIAEQISNLNPTETNKEIENIMITTKFNQKIIVDLEIVVQDGFGLSVIQKSVSPVMITSKNTIDYQRVCFPVAELIQDVNTKLQDLIIKNKLQIMAPKIQGDLYICADKSKLERVFMFLFGRLLNATGQDKYRLTFSKRETGDSLLISLEPNIAAPLTNEAREKMEHLFTQGTSLAQTVIKEHQGYFWVEYAPTLSFRFTIPFTNKVKNPS